MTEPDQSGEPHPKRGFALAAGATATAVVVLALVWIVVSGLFARSDLSALRRDVAALRAALVAGHTVQASHDLAAARTEAAAAAARTSGPAWWVGAQLPGLGAPLRTARGIAAVGKELSDGALVSLTAGGTALDPQLLRTGPDSIDLDRLQEAQQPLTRALPAIQLAQRRVAALQGSWLGPVSGARTELLHQLASIEGVLSDTVTAARVLPPMLGADGPRRYLVVFEGDNEARGIGGIFGGYGVLDADAGRLELGDFGNDGDFSGLTADVTLGHDFNELYGPEDSPEQVAVNADVSPHFPYAAQIWASMATQRFGVPFDGVVALDPGALARLLAVTGPVRTPDGTLLTAGNLVQTLDVGIYQRFDGDTPARKAFFVAAAQAVVHSALHRSIDETALMHALGHASGERRLLVYSDVPAEEAQLAATPLGGVLPQTTRPFADVVVNNVSATKLDSYLERSVVYQRGSCGAGPATVTVTLRNTAPATGLPAYMTAGLGWDGPHPPGTDQLIVALYGTRGSSVGEVRLDGHTAYVDSGDERGHPVTTSVVSLLPGQSRTLVFHVDEPTATGPPLLPVQPLARPEIVRASMPDCRVGST